MSDLHSTHKTQIAQLHAAIAGLKRRDFMVMAVPTPEGAGWAFLLRIRRLLCGRWISGGWTAL